MKIVHTIVTENIVVGFMATITVLLALFWMTRDAWLLKKTFSKNNQDVHDERFGTVIGIVISFIALAGVLKYYLLG